MNLALWLERAGKSYRDWPATGIATRVVRTYAELALRSARLAGALRARWHLAPGDRVAIVAKNSPDYIELLFGIWSAGLVAVPANAKLHGRELGFILEHSDARACFASPGLVDEIAPYSPPSLERLVAIGGMDYQAMFTHDAQTSVPRSGGDLAWLFYTSGTTGRPKGAMLTHRALSVASQAYLTEVDATAPGDRLVHAAPMSHGSGLYIMPTVLRGGLQIVPESAGFEPEEIFRVFDAWPGTSMFAAPTMVKRLVESPSSCNCENIRTIIWGGAPMYVADALAAVDRFGPRLAQIYGQGEAPMTITMLSRQEIAYRDHPRWRERLGSAGRPYACVEVVVAGGNDQPAEPGTSGEILVRGEVVMSGYWRDPEATTRALSGGWLHTGDIGAFDPDGYLILKDRSKDLIISGGSNIYPREVEEVLLAHQQVREASVIGRPDPDWGEIAVAYVVGNADADELDRLCLGAIARFKRPKYYVFLEALPKNNYGKILKAELRRLDAERRRQ
jgi:long-chain acyl-CoA synthetase